jgi:hypothetical protein
MAGGGTVEVVSQSFRFYGKVTSGRLPFFYCQFRPFRAVLGVIAEKYKNHPRVKGVIFTLNNQTKYTNCTKVVLAPHYGN